MRALAAALLLSGCAAAPKRAADGPTVVGYEDYRDPLIKVNRAVFAFNDAAYRWALIPLSKGYEKAVPRGGRRAVARFFRNLETPELLANQLLGLELLAAGRTLSRFVVNSSAGVGGLFDPARAWLGLEREETRFEDTLAAYGVGYGFYLVWPLLGPSDLRNTASLAVGWILNPVTFLLGSPESTFVRSFDSFQEFAPNARPYETLRAQAEDPYLFFRNMHIQGKRRDAEH